MRSSGGAEASRPASASIWALTSLDSAGSVVLLDVGSAHGACGLKALGVVGVGGPTLAACASCWWPCWYISA